MVFSNSFNNEAHRVNATLHRASLLADNSHETEAMKVYYNALLHELPHTINEI